MVINAMEKKSWRRGTGIVVEDLVTTLNSMVWIGLLKTVTFEQRNKKREKKLSKEIKEVRGCRGRELPVQSL